MRTKAVFLAAAAAQPEGREGAPLYLSPVAAGFPSPAEDYVEQRLDLHRHLVRNEAATFFLHASGQSMTGAGIQDGDLLVVDRSVEAAHGRVVIAALDGELLVKCASEWVLMDIETRKFVSVRELCDSWTDLSEERAFDAKPRKIANFEEDPAKAFVVVPSYSDIDGNGHVNNAKYANFVVDALNPGADAALRTFQIDYRREVYAGEPLSVYTEAQEGQVLAKGVQQDGTIAFACRMELA